MLIVIGPTASGKTALAESVAKVIKSEIINADVGQFYVPLTIGTAKPDWKNSSIKHHLFDVLDSPKDLSAYQYRKLVLEKIKEISSRGALPIIAGGSLFYIKSLFFPPKKLAVDGEVRGEELDITGKTNQELWDLLNKIDPDRAKRLHPNDVYRVKRALEIWEKTGTLPSHYEPEYAPSFDATIVVVDLSKDVLRKRINERTVKMFEDSGWIDEARQMLGTLWEDFLLRKNLIGYSKIFQWVKDGEKKEAIPELIESIQIETAQYSKRQMTFLNKFLEKIKQCRNDSSDYFIKVCSEYDSALIEKIVSLCNIRKC